MKKTFLISIWSNPNYYINILFLINFLIKNKIKVILICQKIENLNDFYFFVNKSRNLSLKIINSDSKLGMIKFFLVKFFCIIKYKPSKIISVNFISLFFSIPLKIIYSKITLIYYNFDFNINEDNFNNIIEKFLINFINVIFIPSKERATIYKNFFNYKGKIFEIYNCFSKKFKIKTKKIKDRNLINKKIFIRLGSYNSGHCLEQLISSTRLWKHNSILIIAGISYNNYFNKLKQIKKKLNLSKVILFKNISYKKWFFLLQNAYAGFAFYESINTSHQNMSGTSQKLNNYFYAKIPSFVTKNPDFKKFNKKYKTSILVNSNSANDIANKVNFLINNKKKYKNLKKNTTIVFKKIFNFEKQISKVHQLLN